MNNLKLLSKIALSFQSLNNFDQDMQQVLEDVGSFIDVSRIYIVFNETEEIMKNTFEWCNEGVFPQIQHLQEVHYEDVPSWYPTFINNGYLCSDDIMDLPKDLIDILAPQEIKSILVYPLRVNNMIKGFIGFDECKHKRKWKTDELKMLSTISGIITNAYQRKEFEQEIIASETNFRNFFEIIDDLFIVSDMNGKIIHCNQSLINKSGYSLVELKNMNIVELHPIDQRKAAEKIVEKMLKGDTDYCPLEVQGKLGQIFSVETKIWFGKWDKKDCIYSISKDITKETESLKLVSKIFENNPLPMAITSLNEKTFTKVNAAFLQKTGYLEEDILGKTSEELNLFPNIEKLHMVKNTLLQHEEIKDEEFLLRCKDGRLLDVLLSLQSVKNQGIKSFLSVFVDITLRKKAEKTLLESEKRFFLALDKAEAGLWDFDLINKTVLFSAMWKNMLGYSEDELENSFATWESLWHPDDQYQIQKAMDDYRAGEFTNYEFIHRLKHKNGSWRWILTRGGILKDENKIPYRWIGTNIDVTKEHQQALELERFFSVGLDLFCITDSQAHFIKTNKAWEDVLGYSPEQLNGRKFLDFLHPEDFAHTLRAMAQLNDNEKIPNLINRYISASGNYHYLEWRAIPYDGGIYAAARDVTERMAYEKKILEISNRDPLTNIYNRRYIFQRAEDTVATYNKTGIQFSVCILDIDYFKQINDTYGHQVGDSVLKEFTRVIKEHLRPEDLLGRYGGEEFIVIFNDTNKNNSLLTVEGILDIIRGSTFVLSEHNIQFTFSAGIAHCNEVENDEMIIDRLIKVADERMYYAKRTGRNKIISNIHL